MVTQMLWPVLAWGAESWHITDMILKKVRALQIRVCRLASRWRWHDGMTAADFWRTSFRDTHALFHASCTPGWDSMLLYKYWSWAGHCARAFQYTPTSPCTLALRDRTLHWRTRLFLARPALDTPSVTRAGGKNRSMILACLDGTHRGTLSLRCTTRLGGTVNFRRFEPLSTSTHDSIILGPCFY